MDTRPIIGLVLLLVAVIAAEVYLVGRMPAFRHHEDDIVAEQTWIINAKTTTDDERFQAYFARAARYRQIGQPDKAAADYRVLVRTEPADSSDRTWAERSIIETYAAAGDTRRATAALALYAAEPGHEYSSRLERSRIYRALHDDVHERAELDDAAALDPHVPDAYLLRSRYFDRHGQYDLALADLDTVHSLAPAWNEYHGLRGSVLLHKWDLAGAWREFRALYGQVTAEVQTVTLKARAERELSNQQFGRAIADYSTLIARHPDDASSRLGRANAYLWSGHQDKAFADYKKAVFDQPTQSEPYFQFGKAYFSLLRFDDALAQFKFAVIYTDDVGPRRVRGFVELEANRPDDAAKDFTTALATDKTDIYSILGLHLVRLRAGTNDKKEFAANAAAITTHDWPVPLLAYARGQITRPQLEDAARKVAGRDAPSDRTCEVDFYVGRIALDRGDKATAIPALQAAATSCHPGMIEHTQALWALKQARPGT